MLNFSDWKIVVAAYYKMSHEACQNELLKAYPHTTFHALTYMTVHTETTKHKNRSVCHNERLKKATIARQSVK